MSAQKLLRRLTSLSTTCVSSVLIFKNRSLYIRGCRRFQLVQLIIWFNAVLPLYHSSNHRIGIMQTIIVSLFGYLKNSLYVLRLLAVDISKSQQHALSCCFGPFLWTTLSRRCHFPSAPDGTSRKQRLPYGGFLLYYASLFH